jgi:hypothetical protein
VTIRRPDGSATLAMLLAMVIALLGCGSTVPVTPTAPATPVRLAVRLDGIDMDTGTLRYTDVQIFVNEEADRAAKEDGQPGGAPNPIWIRELKTTGALLVSPEARVTMRGHDAEGNGVMKRTSLATFVRVFTAGDAGGEWTSSPWLYVEVVDGLILSIEQVETP